MNITHHNDPIKHTAINVMHEAIATKAYELWMREGSPENQSDSIWLAAEQELMTGRRSLRTGTAPLPVSF